MIENQTAGRKHSKRESERERERERTFKLQPFSFHGQNKRKDFSTAIASWLLIHWGIV